MPDNDQYLTDRIKMQSLKTIVFKIKMHTCKLLMLILARIL